jgi:hypothetical protein
VPAWVGERVDGQFQERVARAFRQVYAQAGSRADRAGETVIRRGPSIEQMRTGSTAASEG